MNNNLLFGYYAISKNNLWDFGNDPYFHSKPFSWGVCRPNNRTKVKIGSRIFFYTFKSSTSEYYLTGMMLVERILSQIEAANDSSLYCGKEFNDCPYIIKVSNSSYCKNCSPIKTYNTYVKKIVLLTIAKRNCRCNIIVNKTGKYKDFCDANNHIHVFDKHLNSKIYFVSSNESSIATKNKIKLTDYLDKKTEFWKYGRFYGYDLDKYTSDLFEKILRENEYER